VGHVDTLIRGFTNLHIIGCFPRIPEEVACIKSIMQAYNVEVKIRLETGETPQKLEGGGISYKVFVEVFIPAAVGAGMSMANISGLWLMACSACRISEAGKLRLDQLSFEENQWFITCPTFKEKRGKRTMELVVTKRPLHPDGTAFITALAVEAAKINPAANLLAPGWRPQVASTGFTAVCKKLVLEGKLEGCVSYTSQAMRRGRAQDVWVATQSVAKVMEATGHEGQAMAVWYMAPNFVRKERRGSGPLTTRREEHSDTVKIEGFEKRKERARAKVARGGGRAPKAARGTKRKVAKKGPEESESEDEDEDPFAMM